MRILTYFLFFQDNIRKFLQFQLTINIVALITAFLAAVTDRYVDFVFFVCELYCLCECCNCCDVVYFDL